MWRLPGVGRRGLIRQHRRQLANRHEQLRGRRLYRPQCPIKFPYICHGDDIAPAPASVSGAAPGRSTTWYHVAYADPPYLDCCGRYEHYHPDGRCWNDLDTHRALIGRLVDQYPDGWAMSLSSSSLQRLLPLCPPDVRVAAWVKPFAAFKANVRNAYTWEPVIFRGGRVSSKTGAPVTRDHLAEVITLQRGLTGAKPERFCRWVLDMLGYIPGDRVDDLFPGTGVMGRVLELEEGRLTA